MVVKVKNLPIFLNPFALYKKECERGNMEGCVGIGACFIYGKDATQSTMGIKLGCKWANKLKKNK